MINIKQLLITNCLITLIFTFSFSQDTLSLIKAIDIALENNYGIVIARKQLDISEINNHPGAAGMLPKVGITGTRNYQVNDTHQEYYDGRIRDSDKAKSSSFNTGIQLNWTIFDGFNMFIQKDKLEELQYLGESQLRATIESTLAEVIIAYFDIVIQKKMVNVYHESVNISAERKKFAAARLKVGSGSELSFLQASVDLNADSATWIGQLMALDNSKANLNRLLCRDISITFVTENDIPLRTDLIYETLLHKVLEVNPELTTARINLNLASLNIKETRSEIYPRINFSSGYSFNSSLSEVGLLHSNRNLGYIAGLSLTYNIFDGLNTRKKIQTAKIREESARLETQQTEIDLQTRLKRIFNDYETNLRLIQLETENLSLAKRNYSIAEEKFRLGAITDIELRETQNKMMDAESRFLLSQYRCKVAETELLLLSGEI